MTWLPDQWDVLSVAAVVVTVLGGLVALAAGIQGFTATARARRTINWTTEALAHETTAGREKALEVVRTRSEARLLALHYVRWWRFTEVAVFLVVFPPALFLLFGKNETWQSMALYVAFVPMSIWHPLRRGIRAYCERVRVEQEYVDSVPSLTPPRLGMLSLMEGGTNREWLWGAIGAIEITVLVVGATLLASGKSAAWGIVLTTLGAVSLVHWFDDVRRYARGLASPPPGRAKHAKTSAPTPT